MKNETFTPDINAKPWEGLLLKLAHEGVIPYASALQHVGELATMTRKAELTRMDLPKTPGSVKWEPLDMERLRKQIYGG